MKKPIQIVSTHKPVLFRLPGKGLAVSGGTVTSMNGKPVTGYPSVPEGTTLADIAWSAPRRLVRALKTATVAGSRPGVTYTLTEQPNGRWTCSCPGYSFRRTCKHSSAM